MKSSIPMKKPTMLSFNYDEEELDDGEFKIKKSKASKKLKKRMQQAPEIKASTELLLPEVSLGGLYSSESLAELRQKQAFTASKSTSSSLEGQEFGGDVAEAIEQYTEQFSSEDYQGIDKIEKSFSMKTNKNSQLIQPLHSTVTDPIVEYNENERISTSHPTKPLPDFLPLDSRDGEEADWEGDLLRRAISRPLTLSSNPMDPAPLYHHTAQESTTVFSKQSLISESSLTAKNNFNGIGSYKTKKSSVYNTLSISDAMNSINTTITTLRDNCNVTERKIEALNVELKDMKKEELKHQEEMRAEATKLSSIQHLRQYLAEVVGMIRDKEDQMKQLQEAAITSMKQRGERRRSQFIQHQEDSLYLIREAGELLQLGDYIPSAMMTTEQQSSEIAINQMRQRVNQRKRRRKELSDSPHVIIEEVVVEEDEAVYDSDLHYHKDSNTIMSTSPPPHLILKEAVRSLLNDAKPETYSISSILPQLSKFRARDPLQYRDAYISLSLCSLLQPLCMLDISTLPWLIEEIELTKRPWYPPLLDYSTEEGAAGGDEDLLPKVLLGCLLPWTVNMITTFYDPLSMRHSKLLAHHMTQLMDYDPTANDLMEVLRALVDVFKRSVTSLCIPVVKGGSQLGIQFIQQQLRYAERLLQHLSLFVSYLAPATVTSILWSLVEKAQLPCSKLLSSGAQDIQDIIRFLNITSTLLEVAVPKSNTNNSNVMKSNSNNVESSSSNKVNSLRQVLKEVSKANDNGRAVLLLYFRKFSLP